MAIYHGQSVEAIQKQSQVTDERRFEIAVARAKKLVHGKIITAKGRAPYCCLCKKKIVKGEQYQRLSGGLAGHADCALRFSQAADLPEKVRPF